MKEATADEAKEAAAALVEDLESAAKDGNDFTITPEQAKRLSVILRYLIQDPYPDLD